MSHNVATVNDQGGDRLSAITVSVSQYVNEIRIGTNGSNTDAYANSPATTLDNSTLYFYDPSPTNTITGASITSSNDWAASVTLPAGTYLLTAFFSPIFSASGNLFYCFHDGSSYLMPVVGIGGASSLPIDGGGIIQTSVTTTGSTTFSVVAYSKSNLLGIASQGDKIAEESFFIVESI